MNQFGEARFNLFVGRRAIGALGAVALERFLPNFSERWETSA